VYERLVSCVKTLPYSPKLLEVSPRKSTYENLPNPSPMGPEMTHSPGRVPEGDSYILETCIKDALLRMQRCKRRRETGHRLLALRTPSLHQDQLRTLAR
jgi:hypothetical protein